MSDKISRTLKIVEILAEKGPLEIEDIFKYTNIPRSTISKMLTTLEDLGYVFKESSSSNKSDLWYLTLKLLKISKLILSRLDIKSEVRDVLKKLSEEVNEIAQLGVYHDGKVMYVDVIKKPESIISFAGIGTELDINISAAGMVLTSALDETALEDLLKNKIFLKNTKYTLTDPGDIKKELKNVVSNGFAYDNQQYAIGVRCLAAPIYNFDNKIVAAINITGHISTMPDKAIDFMKGKLLKAASEASRIMGYEKNV